MLESEFWKDEGGHNQSRVIYDYIGRFINENREIMSDLTERHQMTMEKKLEK